MEAEERTPAKELAESSHDDKYGRIAEAVAYSVEEGGPRLVHHGESLQAAHENTVGDDKTDIHAQLHADIVGESSEDLVDDGDQRGHHDELHDDADAHRDGLAYEGDDDVGECRDHCYREAHHDGGLEL